MDIRIEQPTPTDTEKIEKSIDEATDPGVVDGASEGEINYIAIRQVLDLSHDEASEYDSEIKTLIDWAKANADSDDHTALKWAVRDLSMRLGTPTHGDRIKHLARFAYLDLEEQRIKKEKRNLI